MNRIIKFRAWDNKNKRMYYQGEPDLEIIQSFFHHYNENDVLMQSTELFDKKGKEIYEGDIVDTSEGNAVIEYNYGSFDIVYPDTGSVILFEDINNITVIGNIYENKELWVKTD